MKRTAIASFAVATSLVLIAAAGPSRTSGEPRGEPTCCGSGSEPGSIAVKHTLTLEGANRALAASMAMAKERGAGGAIAVVDDGGSLIAFARLDGTFAAGADVSIGKARTAAMFKKPTRVFEEAINKGRIALAAVREMTPLQGAVPIMHDGQVVGAIGVSGAHSQGEDEEVAMAGAAAISGETAGMSSSAAK
jgi:glc operon protein GlcG